MKMRQTYSVRSSQALPTTSKFRPVAVAKKRDRALGYGFRLGAKRAEELVQEALSSGRVRSWHSALTQQKLASMRLSSPALSSSPLPLRLILYPIFSIHLCRRPRPPCSLA